MRTPRGLTLVELMIVITVIAVLLLLAAPSFFSLIETQRLRGVNQELLTDVQFARTEALRRGERVGVRFGSAGSGATEISCYTIFRGDGLDCDSVVRHGWPDCDCSRPPGHACANPAEARELRTVQIPARLGVRLRPATDSAPAFVISPVYGGIEMCVTDFVSVDDYTLEVSGLHHGGSLRHTVGIAGRSTVCSPDGSVSGVPRC